MGRAPGRTCATGFAALDQELPGGGWPTHALTELLQPHHALPLAEWRLLLPCLRQIDARLPVALIGPPQPPHAPGLQQGGLSASRLIWVQAHSAAERLWATEQFIKGPGMAHELGAVLAWLPQAQAAQIRRLQTWALQCDAPVFLLRPAAAGQDASAAPLRLLLGLGATPAELCVQVLKRRGPRREEALRLSAWPAGLDLLEQAMRGHFQPESLPPRAHQVLPLSRPLPPTGAACAPSQALSDHAVVRAHPQAH